MRRAKRFIGRALAGLGTVVVFALALILSALLHVDTPPARGVVITHLNRLFEQTFRGSVVVEHLGNVGLDGIAGGRVRISDPEKRQVLLADGVEASVNLPLLLRGLQAGRISIEIPRAVVRHADVHLIAGAEGAPTLAAVFEPRHPKPETGEPGPEVTLDIPQALIGHAWVHGDVVPTGLDGDVDGLEGEIALGSAGASFGVHEARVRLRGMPRGANPVGDIEGKMSLRSGEGITAARAVFDGALGAAPLSVRARMEDGYGVATVRMRETPPQNLRGLLGGIPLQAPLSGTVEAEGTLDRLRMRADIRLGEGRVIARGTARLGSPVRVDAHVTTTRLMVHELAPQGPRADVNLDANVSLTVPESGHLAADVEMSIAELSLDGVPIPATSWNARLRDGVLEGRGTAAEPGAPVEVTYRLTGAPDLSRLEHIDVAAGVRIDDLNGIARVGKLAQGRGTITARARLSFEPMLLDARADAMLLNVANDVVRARVIGATVKADGPLERLGFVGSVRGRDVQVLGRTYEHLRARVSGTPRSLDARAELAGDYERVRAAGLLSFHDGFSVEGARVSAHRRGVRLEARADLTQVSDAGFRLDNAIIEGAGRLEGDVHWGKSTGTIRVLGEDIDIARLARFAGVRKVREGKANVHVDLVRNLRGIDGSLKARVSDLRVLDLPDGDLDVDIHAERGVFTGRMLGAAGNRATARVTLENGRAPRFALGRATGSLAVDVIADLSLLDILPEGWVPTARSRGQVTASARITRARPTVLPDMDAYVALRGLDVMLDEPPRRKAGRSWLSWATTGRADAKVRARFEAAHNRVHVYAHVEDPDGPLAHGAAIATLPARAMLAKPSNALRLLRDAQLFAQLRVPSRSLERLPDPIRPQGVSGMLGLTATASGTLAQPELHVRAAVEKLVRLPPGDERPLDVLAKASYRDDLGRLDVQARRAGRTVLAAGSDLRTNAPASFFSGRPLTWTASARATFDDFPLSTVGWLTVFGLEGRATGDVELDGLHQDARMKGAIRVDGLRIGTGELDLASASLLVEGRRLKGELSLEHGQGSAKARIDTRVVWGDRLVPELVDDAPVDVAFEARRLDTSFLLPFAGTVLGKLEGTLDAQMELTARGPNESVRGFAKLSNGVVQIPTVGQEFRDIEARLVANGSGRIELERLTARGISGELSAKGSAELDGLALEKVHVETTIPKGEELPITLQGVTMGRAWGQVLVEIDMPDGDNRLNVAVRVPKLHVELPGNPGRRVQNLDDAPHVRIGVHQPSGRFDPLPVQLIEGPARGEAPTELRTRIVLGREVWIRQSTKLRVRLTGSPVITSRQEAEMRGQIEITEGFVDVLGKRFEIDQGVATFTDDPADPTVVARARWESPEGVTIVATYTGSAKDGKLELSSEPPYTESEILSILLFGTPEGSMTGSSEGAESGGTASGAAGVGSGIATAGLNRALSDLSDLEITTRVDTSDPAGPRPEVAVQVTRRLSAEIAYNFGAGSAITRTPDHALLTLTLSLPRRWSVETTVGDAGTSIVDLVWRHRY